MTKSQTSLPRGDISCTEKDLQRPRVVVARGNPFADVMLIGEAPGVAEDALGEPFVGRSGQFLENLIKGVGMNPSKDFYISNVVKCRPPNNRKPSKAEIVSWWPWLREQITLVDPHILVLAGSTALEAVLGIKTGISRLRGQWHDYEGRLVMPLFHPAYLLRNPSKAEGAPTSLTVADLIEVRQQLDKFKRTEVITMLDSDACLQS
ncbi:uracil-DNA glycosylase [Prochlorococcus sp. MIT 1300]|uniref:uracil-DNA glycosylase n=1 Tax=Prochlorococcus sp. MIT 1300 TaxID=3096218 RepID=UPI002A754930|nr:uracil-DNA glycosylase [Prochlorococcus sp. MIT 1300]